MFEQKYIKELIAKGLTIDEILELEDRNIKNEKRRKRHNYKRLSNDATYEEKEKSYLAQIEDEVLEIMIRDGYYYIKDGKVKKESYINECHVIWGIQKNLLKDIFEFDWKTPAEQHPELEFF